MIATVVIDSVSFLIGRHGAVIVACDAASSFNQRFCDLEKANDANQDVLLKCQDSQNLL